MPLRFALLAAALLSPLCAVSTVRPGPSETPVATAKPAAEPKAVLERKVPHPLGAAPVDACREFVARLPNVKQPLCQAAALRPTAGRSVQGRTLFSRDVMAPDPKVRVLVVGAMHGDELSSASMALHWIQYALEIPANAHWRFIPALNPDGLMARPAKRVNANGVDLNRNFPTPNWARDAKIYWEERTKKDPRRWPGPKPLSEPETRFFHEEMERFQPDLIVSIHAPYGVLDFDGPTVPPARLGRLYLDQVGIFPGSLGNYGGVHKGMPVVTIELPSAIRTPMDVEMRQMWLDLLRWMSERLAPIDANRGKAVPVKVKKEG